MRFFTITFVLPLAIATCGQLGFSSSKYDRDPMMKMTPSERREYIIKEADEAYALNPSFYDTVLEWAREDDERAKVPSTISVDEYFIAARLKPGSTFKGRASYYGEQFHGRLRADGKKFDMYGISCASKTLPLGAVVDVLNPANKRGVRCTVNDRGPYVEGRDLDLSYGAAVEIGSVNAGVIPVVVTVVSLPRA